MVVDEVADMLLHMVADKVACMVADNFFLQGGRHGGWSRVLVNWAQTFSTDLRVF